MKLKPLFVVGKNNEKEWAGVYGYRPEDSIDSSELYAVIRVGSLSSTIPLEQIAKMLLDELQHSFYNQTDPKDDYIIRLENAAWKMKSQMDVIISREEEISRIGLDIEMAIALIEKNFLYAAVIGESKILINRDGNLTDIAGALIDANLMGFLRTGSLEISEQDRILLLTSKVDDGDVVEQLVSDFTVRQEFFNNNIGSAALMLADERVYPVDQKEEKTVDQEVIPVASGAETEFANELEEITADDLKVSEEDFFANELNESVDLGEKILPQDFPNQDDEIFNVEEQIENNVEEEIDPGELSRFDKLRNSLSDKAQPLKSGIFSKASELKSRFSTPNEETEEFVGDLDHSDSDGSEEIEGAQGLKLNTSLQKEEEIELTGSRVMIIIKRVLRSINSVISKVITGIRNHFKNNNKTYAKYIKDVASKISGLVSSLVELFRREILGVGGDRRDMFTKAKRRRRNRIILVVGIVVVGLVLINSINARNAAIAEQERTDAARSATNELQNTLSQLQSNVAKVKTGSDEEKNSFINNVDSLVERAEAQKTSKLFTSELDSIINATERIKDDVLSITSFTQAQIVTDLGKLYPESKLEDIVYVNGNLYVSDSVRNVIYQIGTVINSQPTQYVTGLVQPSTLVKNVNNDIVFYDKDTTSAIGKISLQENGRVSRYTGLSPGVVGTITSAAIYDGNDALYEIHQNHQQIFKRDKAGEEYVGGGAVYTTANPPNWKTDPEFNSAIDIEAPYEIYVLLGNNGLRRYLGGGDNSITSETFKNTLTTDIESINKATAIHVDGNTLAVADPVNKRVMLFTIEDSDQKNLIFQRQFVYRGADNVFKNIKEIVINQSANALFVLDGTKVIRLDL